MKSEILDNYLQAAEDFVSAAKAVDQKKLLLTPANEEWCGAYVIHHMADFEVHFSHRFLRILTANNPEIESYDETGYVDLLSYSTRGITASLDAVAAMRKLIHEVLLHSDEAVLNRPARHSVKGDIKLKDILQSSTGHVNNHTAQLQAVTA